MKITIHRALSELKLIDAKIEKQTSEFSPSGIYQKGGLINGVYKEDDFKTSTTSKYQSIIDLINRKNIIKSAIVKSNGETSVKVGEKTMTVADAINFKTVVKFKKNLVATAKKYHTQVVGQLNKNNEAVEQNVQALLKAALGKDAVDVSNESVEAIRKPYLEANQFHLFDPLKIEDKIAEIEKEVSEFEVEIDAALSEINAVTFIEVA